MTRVDRICDSLSKSKLIGRALSSSYMYSQIKTALSSVASSFDMPETCVTTATAAMTARLKHFWTD